MNRNRKFAAVDQKLLVSFMWVRISDKKYEIARQHSNRLLTGPEIA